VTNLVLCHERASPGDRPRRSPGSCPSTLRCRLPYRESTIGSGSAPICSISPIWSNSARSSVTLPAAIVMTASAPASIGLPDGGLSLKLPLLTPVSLNLTAARSPSAITSSIWCVRSGIAA
jgi:hypothetical protein